MSPAGPTSQRAVPSLVRAIPALSAAATAATAWFASARYGLGVDGDAGWTLSAADALARGDGLVTCLDEVYSLWPPLYPALIAGLDLAFGDPLPALRVLHVLAAAATVVLAARLAARGSGREWAGAWTAVLLALSSRLHEYTVQVVSETLFLPLVLGALLAAALAIETRRGRWLALATALSALACLQRYLGAVVVAVIGIALLFERGGTRGSRIRRATAHVAASIAPLVAWFLRNYLVDAGRWTGGRDPARQTLAEIASDSIRTTAGWSAFAGAGPWSGYVLLGAAAIALIVGRKAFASRATVALMAGFVAVYASTVVLASSAVQVDRVGDRLMLPVMPVLVALGGIAAGGAVAAASSGGWGKLATRGIPALVLGIGAALAFDSGRRLEAHVGLWRREGAGSFRTRFWLEHPLVEPLAAVELHEPVYSNAPEHVWLLHGARGRFLKPHRIAWSRAAAEIEASGRPATIVWFQAEGRPKAGIDSLGEGVEVDELVSGPDGTILEISPRLGGSPSLPAAR